MRDRSFKVRSIATVPAVLLVIVLNSLGLFSIPVVAQSSPTVVTSSDLLADAAVLRDAFEALHPGLYRYNDSLSLAVQFEELRETLHRDLNLPQAYLAFSRFAAAIRCGHTYANFWNQPERVRDEVLLGPNKLPFTFLLIERRMLVQQDATQHRVLPHGSEILSIDGRPVGDILDSLIQLVPADGSNDRKRLYELRVSGVGEYEAFDVYYPLLFPIVEGAVELTYRNPDGVAPEPVAVQTVTRAERLERIVERYGPQPETYDDLWQFELWDDSTAYLRLGTFVIWKMDLDWVEFLRVAFDTIAARGIDNLVLDLRGNAGGDDAVLSMLERYLVWKTITEQPLKELLRYETVPHNLEPYLDTWDNSFKDRTGSVVRVSDRFYTWATIVSGRAQARTRRPHRDAFAGNTFVLIDAANSSATFMLASLLQQQKLATLVGQATGGSRRGINGGQMFFLRLPNSGIEVDLPLIGYFPDSDQPDAGIEPDMAIDPIVTDVQRGVDTVLEAVRALLRQR